MSDPSEKQLSDQLESSLDPETVSDLDADEGDEAQQVRGGVGRYPTSGKPCCQQY
ncbi:MAG TPA: hypothetical protein VLJ76_05685 [Gaiellaceae bacterium]|nr:hypothetical protein [Gaiellaceae bacterium]